MRTRSTRTSTSTTSGSTSRAVVAVCDGDVAAGANGRRSPGERFRWLVAPRSTVVQTSPVHTGITDDPQRELEDLVARMVASPSHGPDPRLR